MSKTLFATLAIASVMLSAPAFANDAKTGGSAPAKKACAHKACHKKATKRHAAAPKAAATK